MIPICQMTLWPLTRGRSRGTSTVFGAWKKGVALASSTPWAGISKLTNHSAKNSIILASSLGKISSTSLMAASTAWPRVLLGILSVRFAQSSEKYRRAILVTHWPSFSRSMVILASGHGSGRAVKQWRSSDVTSFDMTAWRQLPGCHVPRPQVLVW